MTQGTTTGAATLPVDAADYAVGHPLRPLVLAGQVTLIADAGGVLATGFVWPWIVAECLFLAAWFALVVIMWFRQPDARETVTVWGHASRALTYLSQGFVARAIWTFFLYCPEAQRLMLAAMFMPCSPAQLIATPENVMANRVGILASNGSPVAWLALNGSPNGYAIGGFALVIGNMSFLLCGYLPGTVAATVPARLEVEESKAELAPALDLAPSTVMTHLSLLLVHLSASNRTDASIKARMLALTWGTTTGDMTLWKSISGAQPNLAGLKLA